MPKFRLPPLNSLRAFEAAARLGSIKAAGGELHVHAAAVSRHILKLERRLDRRLFERRNRTIVLTDAGRILMSAVTTGFAHIHLALTQLSSLEEGERLVISVDLDFAGLWLVPRLAEFSATVPNTLVEILAEKTDMTLHDPRIDCAIQYAPADLELDNCQFLFRSRLFPVCTRPLAESMRLRSPADLTDQMLIHDRSLDEWAEYLRDFRAADFKVRSGIVLSETALCLDAAARGQGVAMGDDFLAAGHLSEGRLIKPFGAGVLSPNAYYFVVPQSRVFHPMVEAFRAWLLRSIERVRQEAGADPPASDAVV